MPEVRRAGWWARVAASVIDALLTVVPVLVIGIVAGAHPFGHHNTTGHLVMHTPVWYAVLGIGVTWAYELITECRPGTHNGQTLGKQLLAIKVVRDDGRPFSPVTFAIRDVLCRSLVFWSRFLNALSLPFGLLQILDDLWPLWDSENRALHDFIAHTHVLRT